jgi:hypothetical protein
LPDPTGWNVYSEWGTGPYLTIPPQGYGVANDWTATATTSVTGLYFWGSWKDGIVGQSGDILIQIFSNDTGEYDPAFARPNECIWSNIINEGDYTSSFYDGTGDAGWYDPRYTNQWSLNNQDDIYEYSIIFEAPFEQVAGETYWLSISMATEGGEWGWLTSLDVQDNPSVFWDSFDYYAPHPTWSLRRDITWKWTTLETPTDFVDPRVPVDLAFVLTPEPAALLLLSAGAILVLKKRNR